MVFLILFITVFNSGLHFPPDIKPTRRTAGRSVQPHSRRHLQGDGHKRALEECPVEILPMPPSQLDAVGFEQGQFFSYLTKEKV